ncbi:MAG: MBL fold metallo-hydrolase [Candidatus Binataceae bacterium]|nr:MBL fold metallo-hydrolase [Candidatus Binataceae bacterium]
MIFKPFYYFDTGCAAYVFGCSTLGKCAVVDPQARDIESYAAFAETKGMRITHVIDTHLHADHLSGGRSMAALAGAVYCLHRSAEVWFAFAPLDDGQTIELGNTIVQVIHTPGHTSESICLLVSDLRRGPEPWFLLSGDTLFVGAVGRPDLPGHTRDNAAQLYASLQEKLLTLPATLEVYPAHFAGSACGAGMSGKPATTLAFEQRWNPTLALNRDDFIATVSEGIPAKPAAMEAILRANQGLAG